MGGQARPGPEVSHPLGKHASAGSGLHTSQPVRSSVFRRRGAANADRLKTGLRTGRTVKGFDARTCDKRPTRRYPTKMAPDLSPGIRIGNPKRVPEGTAGPSHPVVPPGLLKPGCIKVPSLKAWAIFRTRTQNRIPIEPLGTTAPLITSGSPRHPSPLALQKHTGVS